MKPRKYIHGKENRLKDVYFADKKLNAYLGEGNVLNLDWSDGYTLL